MCEALGELMKDEIGKTVAEAVAEAVVEAAAEGRESALLSSIANLMDIVKITAEQAMDTIKIPLADRSRYAAKL